MSIYSFLDLVPCAHYKSGGGFGPRLIHICRCTIGNERSIGLAEDGATLSLA